VRQKGTVRVEAAELEHVEYRQIDTVGQARIATGLSMSELNLPPGQSADNHSFSKAGFFRRQLPFLAILTLAIAGVAYTNISRQSLVGYWEFLALAVGVVCVITEWVEVDDRQARFRLMWTQALHWAAVLVAMNIMLLSGVQQLLPAPATSLVLLILLALGTFLAGLNLLSVQISFLGMAMALAVPAISWIQQSFLFLGLAAVFVIGLGMTFWSRRGDAHSTKPARQAIQNSSEPKSGDSTGTETPHEDGLSGNSVLTTQNGSGR
jgi:hypothetical protein